MSIPRLVVVDGVRTPFARAGSDLAGVPADELGRIAVSALLAKTGIDPALVNEVIFGCVGQPSDATNVGRVIALRAGIPRQVPAITVSRNCASGLEAVTQAQQKMAAGVGDVFVVGGTESMSQYPLLFPYSAAVKFTQLSKAKTLGQRLGAMAAFRSKDFAPRISLMLGLSDPVVALNMGETAEVITRENGITRAMQDAFAIESHKRANAAREKLAEEITPAYVGPDFKKALTADNGPRTDQTPEVLAKLKTVFDRRTGTVTAGNSSQISDGAVALLVMTEARAAALGYQLVGYRYAGCDPARMGLGPLAAIAAAERATGLKLADADLIEINEAFAGQVLAVMKLAESEQYGREMLGRDGALGKVPHEILNVNGGAVALGHPVGASGARLVLTALRELRRRGKRRALVSLCVGGGQGAALWFEGATA